MSDPTRNIADLTISYEEFLREVPDEKLLEEYGLLSLGPSDYESEASFIRKHDTCKKEILKRMEHGSAPYITPKMIADFKLTDEQKAFYKDAFKELKDDE